LEHPFQHIYFLEVWNELKAIISYFEKKFSKAIMVEAPGNIKKKNLLHDEIITEVYIFYGDATF
jgi:hypothetical protein